MARKPKGNRSPVIAVLTVVMVLSILLTAGVIYLCVDLVNREVTPTATGGTIQLPTRQPEPSDSTEETAAPTEETQPPAVTATIGVVGDVLMHKQLFQAGSDSVNNNGDGTYDFHSIFQYLDPYTQGYDYAVANLETTISGESYPYQGNPHFNCPDELLESIKDGGFDALLTANNHIYDCKMPGLQRTMEKIQEQGLAYLGSRKTEEEKRYQVVDINGIPIGMVCYTFTTSMLEGKPRLNGDNPVENPALINYFFAGRLNDFYAELETVYQDMVADGALGSVIYIHWGNEYELAQNSTQTQIAQKICDLGFDVIVGGHPHVVQPMDLLTSTTDPEHKTVCIYSLGNVVSNQRASEMRLRTGHTEDGVLFTVTFQQGADGSVFLSGADVMPTWTNMHFNNGGREYNILPLDKATEDQWADLYSLDATTLNQAKASWQRTEDLVATGLQKCQDWMKSQQLLRELE